MENQSTFQMFWHCFFHRKVIKKAVKVAIIVGIILNLINQGDVIITMEFSQINWSKFILTFFVPYSVSSYSAAVTLIDQIKEQNAK